MGQLTVMLCLHKGKHTVNSSKKKNSSGTGEMKLDGQDCAVKIKQRNKCQYNSLVTVLAEFINWEETNSEMGTGC